MQEGFKKKMGVKRAGKSQPNLVFTEFKAKEFLKKYGEVPKGVIISVIDIKKMLLEKKFTLNFAFPVVLKISSDILVHKTEENAVKVVYNEADFFRTLNEMSKKLVKLKARGVLVEEFVKGQEIIIGIKKDKTFGHVIGLGIGGVFTEFVRDISFRVCPLDEKDFYSMLDDLKMKDIIMGIRGKKNNIELLKDMVLELSKIPEKNSNISELDINPVILNEKECKIADARIVFDN
jgi:hypothetical protein